MTVTRPGAPTVPSQLVRTIGTARPASVALAVAAAAGVAVDAVANPHTTHIPLCPIHAVTGLDCPLCGGLRAVFDITRLHFGTAVHDNALLVAGLPVLLAWWWLGVARARRGQPRPAPGRWVITAIVVVAIAFTVFRNVPLGAALAPR